MGHPNSHSHGVCALPDEVDLARGLTRRDARLSFSLERRMRVVEFMCRYGCLSV